MSWCRDHWWTKSVSSDSISVTNRSNRLSLTSTPRPTTRSPADTETDAEQGSFVRAATNRATGNCEGQQMLSPGDYVEESTDQRRLVGRRPVRRGAPIGNP